MYTEVKEKKVIKKTVKTPSTASVKVREFENNNEFVFLKSIIDPKDTNHIRIVILDGQYYKDDDNCIKKYDETLYVSASKEMRKDLPIGTVFGLKTKLILKNQPNSSRNYYDVAEKPSTSEINLDSLIIPILLPDGSRKGVFNLSTSTELNVRAGISVNFDLDNSLPIPILLLFKGNTDNVYKYKQQEQKYLQAFKKYDLVKDIPIQLTETRLTRIKRLYPTPTIKKDGYSIEEDQWTFMIRNVEIGRNTLLVGPTGTAKTEIVNYLSNKIYGKDAYCLDMGAMHDPLPAMLGTHRISSKGVSEFDYSQLFYEIQKPGIICLDELSRAPLSTNNILFPLLDNRRTLNIDIACSSGVRCMKAHENCTFFATANIGMEYTGTNILDKALSDRFDIIEMQYLSPNEETELIINRTGIGRKEAEKVSKICADIRGLAASGKISSGVSARHAIAMGGLISDGFSIKKAATLVIEPLYGYDEAGIEDKKSVVAVYSSL